MRMRAIAAGCLLGCVAAGPARAQEKSAYAGEEARAIKALSEEDVAAYLEGHGAGLARAAELNHYPGPRHVLDLADELGLTAEQKAAAQGTFDAMHAEAVRLGQEVVAQERRLDEAFASGRLDEASLRAMVTEAARLQGDLRLAHLRAHLAMRQLLTPAQVARYDALRGYAAGAPAAHRH